MPIDIERNPGAVVELGAENPPDVPLYVLRVGVRGGFGRTRAGLPVYRRENPSPHPMLKEIYQCEVAGKVLEAANIYALRAKVQRQLEVIAPGPLAAALLLPGAPLRLLAAGPRGGLPPRLPGAGRAEDQGRQPGRAAGARRPPPAQPPAT